MGNICDHFGPRNGKPLLMWSTIDSIHPVLSAPLPLCWLPMRCISYHTCWCCKLSYCVTRVQELITVDVGSHAGFAVFLCITSSFVASMAAVTSAPGFIVVRLLIGFGLATFVSNQYWTSSLFTPTLVGMANAVAGGWGNAGVPCWPVQPCTCSIGCFAALLRACLCISSAFMSI